jgi:hypothetical protein
VITNIQFSKPLCVGYKVVVSADFSGRVGFHADFTQNFFPQIYAERIRLEISGGAYKFAPKIYFQP